MSTALIADELLQRIVDLLRREPAAIYIAGGYVRDWLLGQPSNDIDFAVDAPAIPLARRLANATGGAFYVLDEETDAARIVYRSPAAERGAAGSAAQAEWTVDLARLRGGGIVADLQSRDFTVNAMAVDVRCCHLPDPPVLDPCAGRCDLAARLLRATSERTFISDPARLLRAVRFAAALNLTIEPLTESWLRRDAPLITQPSPERIRQELVLILAAPDAASHVRRMDELGLLGTILPEVTALKGVTQCATHHAYDVYEHTLHTVSAVERLTAAPPAPLDELADSYLGPWRAELTAHLAQVMCEKRPRSTLLKLAALLHDVGKPDKRTVKESGHVHFLQHERLSAEKAAAVLSRLHFSAQEVEWMATIVAEHMRPGFLVKDAPVRRRAMYRFFRDTGHAAVDVLILSLADHLAARGPALVAEEWDAHLAFTREMLEHYFRQPQQLVTPPALVTGSDVMVVLGIPPGPEVGRWLEAVREAQAEGEVRTREEALTWLRLACHER